MKPRFLALILLISLAGTAAAVNSGNFQRNRTQTNRHHMLSKGDYSEHNFKKVLRKKKLTKQKWQESNHKRNKDNANCQIPEKTSFKTRRKK